MHKRSLVNQKLVIQPLIINLFHEEVFMGPCRYGSGEQLTYEYEKKTIAVVKEKYDEDITKNLDTRFVDVLESKVVEWTENFAFTDKEYRNATKHDDVVDIYLITGGRMVSYLSTIIAKRTGKPLAYCPTSFAEIPHLGGVDASAHMKAIGFDDIYNALTYEDLNRYFRIMKVKKALKSTRAMYALRNNVLSVGAVSSFIDLNDFYDKLGMETLHYDARELFKDMDELTEEECQEAQSIADALVQNSEGVHMPAEYIVNDVKYYLAVKKVLEKYECNAFTCPCFEMCATKELNKRKLTFCLTHSLLKDEGIPSSCASDVNTLACYQILMNLAGKAPHMGNCMPMVKDLSINKMRILHDVPCRFMKGYEEKPLEVSYVNFALDGWGATMRYDFAKDAGETITMINLSPKLDKMMIATGEITGCDDYLTPECRLAVVFKVEDAKDFYRKEQEVGHHYAWVYGDYTEDLLELARVLDMETIIA